MATRGLGVAKLSCRVGLSFSIPRVFGWEDPWALRGLWPLPQPPQCSPERIKDSKSRSCALWSGESSTSLAALSNQTMSLRGFLLPRVMLRIVVLWSCLLLVTTGSLFLQAGHLGDKPRRDSGQLHAGPS